MPADPVNQADVARAAARITGRIRRTPLIDIEAGTLAERRVALKLELLQHTGSFKVRGAFNRLLAADVPDAGVVVASGGNAGLAVAYAARELGYRAEVFVPVTAPAIKLERLTRLGATVRLSGASYADALGASTEAAELTGALVVHAYDQADVVAGQGTVALEMEAAAGQFDTLIVAVGGGGLVSGAAAWCGDRVNIVAVETEGCPTLTTALRRGAPIDVDVSSVAADSLGARRIGSVCWALRGRIATCLTVSDQAVHDAQRRLWAELRVIAEPGGATALAALTSGRYVPDAMERVAVIVCGGNTEPSLVSTSPTDGSA